MNDQVNKGVENFLMLLALLILAWLLWSGIYKLLLLGLGAFSCLLCFYIAYRIGFFKRASGLRLIPSLPKYWFALLIDIIKSSIDVAKIVLNPKLPISPVVVEIDAMSKGSIGHAILGNAITLSPGTVTLDVHNGRLRVHCLTRKSADELLAGEINRRTSLLTHD